MQDVWGLTCVESATTKPLDAKGDSSGPIRFKTSDLCKPTGIMAEKGARYLIEIKPVGGADWSDDGIPVPLGGFSPANPPVWYHRLRLAMAVPLRRETTQDWFHVVLRYGRIGGEETFIVPDPDDPYIQSPIRATRNGEIFVFVNDAVIGIPGLYDYLLQEQSRRGRSRDHAAIKRFDGQRRMALVARVWKHAHASRAYCAAKRRTQIRLK